MKNQDDSQHHLNSHSQLPDCPLSTQCLLYADMLNSPGGGSQGNQDSWSTIRDDRDVREERLIEQLRAHVPTCPTCRAILAEVRSQREAIRSTLQVGEREVPSTAPRIIAAIRQESAAAPRTPYPSLRQEHSQRVSSIQSRIVETPMPERRRGRWMEFLSIAVAAALVLLTIGVLGRFVMLNGSMGAANSAAGSTSNGSGTSQTQSASWSSVIVTYTLNGTSFITNYNPLSGQHAELAAFTHAQVAVDGVAHSGIQVLYHVYDGSQTRYYVYPDTQKPVYTITGQGNFAIWSSGDNDHYLFINTGQGIAQIDMVAHSSHLLSLPKPATSPMALFYRDNYLYFVQAPNPLASYSSGILYRLNLQDNQSNPTQVTPCSHPTNPWLSPSGSTIYYNCGSQGQNALYAVNVDGTNAHLLRTDAGPLIGYASDYSLIVLRVNEPHLQVVQLGASTQQDRVILPDIAPGATSVQASDIAVAPYGYALVTKATYANNVEKLLYSDLMTQDTQDVPLPVGVHNVHAIGWDKLIPTPSAG